MQTHYLRRRAGRMPGRRSSTTADGWNVLGEHNLELGYRYVEIMCGMNRASYGVRDPANVVRRMARFPCEYYYYRARDFEVVCGLKWQSRRRLYQLMSVGFVGAITPAGAVELVVERGRHFFREKRVDHVVAIEPAFMENAAIMEFYRLVRQHPVLTIRGTHRVHGGTYLWIRMRWPV